MSSSDDDAPLLARRPAHAHRQMGLPRSDSDSPLPDWLSQHASPPKPLELLSDSDEDDDHVVKHDAHPQSSDKGPDDEKEQNGGGQHGRANRTKWKAHASVLLSSDDEERPQNGVQESAKRQKVPQAAGPVGPGAGKGKKLQQADLKGWMQSQAASNDGTVPQSQQAAGEAEDATQGAAGPSSQPAKEKKAAAKAAMVASLKGEIPVMLPEKLPANKFIVELETGNDSSTDLAGDAGVVGRWLVQQGAEAGAQPELQLDLKGVLYQASVVPCASTLCIVNLGASEARVELLASQFVALRREAGAGGLGDGEAGNDHFLFDDDDNYQFPGGMQQRGNEDGDGPGAAKKKGSKAAGGGGAKKKPAAKRGVGAKPAGAKKKPAKPGGKAKSAKK